MSPPSPTRERLMGSPQEYATAMSSREVFRQASTTVISHIFSFTAMHLGLDNRALLPPFMPRHRNEDGTFAYFLSRLMEDAYQASLPFTLCHNPLDPRQYHGSGKEVRIADVIRLCAVSWRGTHHRAGTLEEQLKALGLHFTTIGTLPPRDFEACIRHYVADEFSFRLSRRETALANATHRLPSHWMNGIKNDIMELRAFTRTDTYFVPADILTDHSPAERLNETQRFVRQYGQLLYWWPEIVRQSVLVSLVGWLRSQPS